MPERSFQSSHTRAETPSTRKANGAQVLQIQNLFQESQEGRQPKKFDFLQLTLNAHFE